MDKKLIVCGDSFSIGIGCLDLENEPYGCLLSKKLNIPLINLAKGSSTNMSIFLQAKYAVEKLANKDDIVIVSNTSYDRVEWFPFDTKIDQPELSNTDVNYHQYPPYGYNSYYPKGAPNRIQLENPMKDDTDYNGYMFTENFAGIVDYWENFRKDKNPSVYYDRFTFEDDLRIKTLYDYATLIHDSRINRIYSIGVLGMAHQLLKRAGIKHLILTHEIDTYSQTIDMENLAPVDWGYLSFHYPDKVETFHTSPEGQQLAYEYVLKKLQENGWA
jgi:hypothetical protein